MAEGNGHGAADWHPPTPKFTVDVANAPKITLAGMEFPIPLLAVKQNRIIVPALLSLSGMMTSIASVAGGDKSDPRWFDKISISTAQFDTLCDIVYTAITRGTPGFGRGEFDNMPISMQELIVAMMVVAGQTGMLGKPGEATPSTGEVRPTDQPAAPAPA